MFNIEFLNQILPHLKFLYRRNSYRLSIGVLMFRAISEFSLYFAIDDVAILYSYINDFLGAYFGGFIIVILKIFVFTDSLWVFGLLCLFILILLYANYKENKIHHSIYKEKGHEPIISKLYLKRNIDKTLYKRIKNDKVLLLTGESFCGKSEISKQIAYKLNNNGYLFKRVDDTKEAISFLTVKDDINRICVLEDPFGHTFSNEKENGLRNLRNLIDNLTSKSLLIVTTRTEVLLNVSGAQTIDELQINKFKWIDLSNTDNNFLIKLWESVTKEQNLSESNIKLIAEYLKNENILQIGQLIHLSRIDELKEKNYSIEELIHLAQVDAKELSASIFKLENQTWFLMAIFAFTLDTFNGVSFSDLQYILNKSRENLSLEEYSIFTSIEITGEEKEFIFPTYQVSENTIDDFTNELSFLERRGYIKLVNSKYIFAHPQYKEIAKYVFKGLSSSQQKKITINIFNSLTCLNIEVAHNTAKSLDFIFENLNKSFHEDLFKSIYKVFDSSLFPKVIDKCFILLLNKLETIESKELTRDILFKLETSREESDIIYYLNEPIKWRKSDHFNEYFNLIKEEDFKDISSKILQNKEVTTKEVFQALKYQRIKRPNINIELIVLGLKSDEVFVRNLSAYNYMARLTTIEDNSIFEAIINDSHPSVIFNGLKAFFENLFNYDKATFDFCLDKFKTLFNDDKIFCIRSSSLMTTFATDYAHESVNWREIEEANGNKIWYSWGELFPIFLNSFPSNVRFPHTPRFSGTIRDSVTKLTSSQGLIIAEHLFKYIYHNINKRLFDTHELILTDFLIKVTENEPEIRYDLFKKIFSVSDTGFFIYSYSWIVSKWDKLTSNEIQFIIDVLSSDRVDLRWIKAGAVAVSFEPPKEIQKAIFYDELYFSQNIPDIVNKMDSDLFLDSLKIYTGDAHIIDWYGLSHGSKVWQKVCIHILENNHKNGFEMALGHFLNDFINGAWDEEWGSMKDLWKKLFHKHDDQEFIVNLLIEEISECTCNLENVKYAFKIIIKWYKKNNKTDVLVRLICDKIEVLTITSHERDLATFLSYKKFLFKEIVPALKGHKEIIELVYQLKTKEFDEETNDKKVNRVVELSNLNQIRLYFVFDFIKEIAEENRIGDENIKKLKNIPNLIEYTQNKHKENKPTHDDYYGLDKWVSLLGVADLEYEAL